MDIVLRILLIYVFIFAALRLIGKREFGQLSPIELVTLLLIPEIVSEALTHEDPSVVTALIGVATLLVAVFVTSLIALVSKRGQQVIESSPRVLYSDGVLYAEALNEERIPPDEIMGELRKAGLERLDQVRWAVLESDGRISIVPKDPARAPASRAAGAAADSGSAL